MLWQPVKPPTKDEIEVTQHTLRLQKLMSMTTSTNGGANRGVEDSGGPNGNGNGNGTGNGTGTGTGTGRGRGGTSGGAFSSSMSASELIEATGPWRLNNIESLPVANMPQQEPNASGSGCGGLRLFNGFYEWVDPFGDHGGTDRGGDGVEWVRRLLGPYLGPLLERLAKHNRPTFWRRIRPLGRAEERGRRQGHSRHGGHGGYGGSDGKGARGGAGVGAGEQAAEAEAAAPSVLYFVPAQSSTIGTSEPGQFFEVYKLPNFEVVQVYRLYVVCRSLHRTLVFSTDSRWSLKELSVDKDNLMARSEPPWRKVKLKFTFLFLTANLVRNV